MSSSVFFLLAILLMIKINWILGLLTSPINRTENYQLQMQQQQQQQQLQINSMENLNFNVMKIPKKLLKNVVHQHDAVTYELGMSQYEILNSDEEPEIITEDQPNYYKNLQQLGQLQGRHKNVIKNIENKWNTDGLQPDGSRELSKEDKINFVFLKIKKPAKKKFKKLLQKKSNVSEVTTTTTQEPIFLSTTTATETTLESQSDPYYELVQSKIDKLENNDSYQHHKLLNIVDLKTKHELPVTELDNDYSDYPEYGYHDDDNHYNANRHRQSISSERSMNYYDYTDEDSVKHISDLSQWFSFRSHKPN